MNRRELRDLRRRLRATGHWPPLGVYFRTSCPVCLRSFVYLVDAREGVDLDALVIGEGHHNYEEAVRKAAAIREAARKARARACPHRN